MNIVGGDYLMRNSIHYTLYCQYQRPAGFKGYKVKGELDHGPKIDIMPKQDILRRK
jgi:hypothetical protein